MSRLGHKPGRSQRGSREILKPTLMMRSPLVPITVCLCGGIWLALLIPLNTAIWVGSGFILAAAAFIFSKNPRLATTCLLFCWIALGAAHFCVWRQDPVWAVQSRLAGGPSPAILHGFIRESLVDANSFGGKAQTTVVDLAHVRTPQGWLVLNGRLRATVDAGAALRAGDEVLMEGQWREAPQPSNPGQYDWKQALARAQITGLFEAKPYQPVVVLGNRFAFGWRNSIARLRLRLSRLIERYFSASCAGILQALVLGQKAGLADWLKRIFIETGTMHLLVISGANVALIALMAERIFRMVIFSWRLRFAGVAAVLGIYCLLTGSQPPVVRATVMAWVVLGAGLLDRPVCWANVLAAACCVMVLFNPCILWDPSAELSFAAVASLLLFYPRFNAAIARIFPLLSLPGLRWLVSSIAATVAVWIGLWPILADYFYLFAPVAIVANLVLAPLLSGITVAGLGLLGVSLAGFSAPLALGSSWISKAAEMAIQWTAICHRMPGGFWVVGLLPAWIVLGYYTLLFVSLCRQRLRLRLGSVFSLWVAFAVLAAGAYAAGLLRDSRWLYVDFIDVGHGDSILIQTPKGLRMLVDTGTQTAGSMRVLPFLRCRGVGSLDALLLTHPDEDHIGGAMALLPSVRIAAVFTNGAWDDTASAHSVARLIKTARIPQTVLCAGMRLSGDPGVAVEVLHPPCGLVPGVPPDGNDNSVVLRLQAGDVSFLLTGDIEEKGIPWLVKNEAMRQVDVLKVPHHGSRLGAAGEALFQAAHPQMAVISVGSAHGLPAAETQAALENLRIPVYTTSNLGGISLRTDGHCLQMRMFKKWKNRWQVVLPMKTGLPDD